MGEPLHVKPAYWSGKRVLVTGSSGFLGGWLVARLLDYGAEVVAIVRRDRPESQFVLAGLERRCLLLRGDISDPSVFTSAFDSGQIDAAFHTAADSDVENVYKFPAESYRSTIGSTLNLLETARIAAPNCAIVVSSSDKAYGPQQVPYREAQNLAPRHPYEVAKACQDLMAQSYGKVYGLPVAITRSANYFGGWDFNWHRIIPGTIRSIMQGGPVVLRSDGKFIRDFLYIEDAVDTQLVLAQALAKDPKIRGEAFNFSHEVDIEVFDIVEKLCKLMTYCGAPQVNNTAKAEIRVMQTSSDKARHMLNWQPRFDFDAALVATVNWYRDYLDAYGHRSPGPGR